MGADVVANPPAAGESKSARKKKAKAEATTTPTLPSATEQNASELGNGSDPAGKANGDSENAYIKELQKCVPLHVLHSPV